MSEAVSRRCAMRLLGAMGAALGTGGCVAAVPPGAVPRTAPATAAAAPAGARPGSTARIDVLLERLTLEEKTALLHGGRDPAPLGQAGYLPGVPRLGIPALRLADGPAGVRVARPATALPAPVMLASAFDPALAREYGRVIGREGRALGQDVLLSPMANLIRTPYAGRNFETFAEDPGSRRTSSRRRSAASRTKGSSPPSSTSPWATRSRAATPSTSWPRNRPCTRRSCAASRPPSPPERAP